MPNIFNVADYILRKPQPTTDKKPRRREPMTAFKLQAMCYFVQAQYLVATNGTALFEQDFQAHTSCPVCQELYDLVGYCPKPDAIPQDMLADTLTPEQEHIIDCVIARYASYTSDRICHTATYGSDRVQVAKPGKPWHIARKKTMAKIYAGGSWDSWDGPCETISKDDMLKYTQLYKEIPSLAPCQPYSACRIISCNGKAKRIPSNSKHVATPCTPD